MSSDDLRRRLNDLLPLVAETADGANRARRPDPEVFKHLAEAGLLRVMAPVDYGGGGADPGLFTELVEAVARVDGSTAWTMMTLNEEVGLASAYLPAPAVSDMLTNRPDVIIAGSGVPRGRVEPVSGGYRVSGRWTFVSGSTVADELVLAAWLIGTASAERQLCFVLVEADRVQVEDTWHVAGLRGTASNDVVVDDVFVADERAGLVDGHRHTVPDTPFYRLPPGLRFPFPKVGVASGIARAAIEDFVQLAADKKPSLHSTMLAERPHAQAALARAEILAGSGPAWVGRLLAEVWADAVAGHAIDPGLHARTRLACSSAVDGCIEAVQALASAAGTTAGWDDGPWPRMLADVRAVAQHFMVGPQLIPAAGRVLLGLDPDDPTF